MEMISCQDIKEVFFQQFLKSQDVAILMQNQTYNSLWERPMPIQPI